MTDETYTDEAEDTPHTGPRVTSTFEEAQTVGFLGREVDPTPDENYSVQTPPHAPVPENDADAHAAAQHAVTGGSTAKFPKES